MYVLVENRYPCYGTATKYAHISLCGNFDIVVIAPVSMGSSKFLPQVPTYVSSCHSDLFLWLS